MSGSPMLEVIGRHTTAIEAMARAICEADGVDPDKEVCGMGVQLPAGELAPAWRARVKQAEAAQQALFQWLLST